MRLLTCYENLLSLSKKMEALAREQAWDELTQTEAERRTLVDSLPASRLAALPPADQQAIAMLIQQIQHCDQTVRDYVLSWQDSVSKLLARSESKL